MKNIRAASFQSAYLPKGKEIANSFIGHVYFGSPLNECAGHGICKIIETDVESLTFNPWSPCITIAHVINCIDGNYMIQVLKSSIGPRLFNKQFSGSFFRVDADFNMSKFFPYAKNQLIKSGNYAFKEDDNFIHIDFGKMITLN